MGLKTGLARTPWPAQARAVVAVMDAELAALAWRRGVPCFYVDSLFPMWRLSTAGRQLVLEMLEAGPQSWTRARWGQLSRHERVLAAHAASTLSFVQVLGPGRAHDGLEHLFEVQTVEPIVDLSLRVPRPRDTVLISLSGARMDGVRRTAYVEFVERLLVSVPSVDVSRLVLVGPDGLRPLAEPFGAFRTLAFDDMLAEYNRARVVVAPPGLTTLFEAMAYGAPVVFLPEQHQGHVHNLGQLRAAETAPSAFEGALLTEEGGSAYRSDRLGALAEGRDPELERALKHRFRSAVTRCLLAPEVEARRQFEALREVVGEFRGAAQIAAQIAAASDVLHAGRGGRAP